VPTIEDVVGCCDEWAHGNPAWDLIIPLRVRDAFLAAIDALRGDELLACYCQDLTRCHGQVVMRLWEERWKSHDR
jgi:Domain of unknown function (DUF4326)